MIRIKNEFDNYLEIYSDKLIYEPSINKYWNATEEEPIAVDKGRFANGEYIEIENEIVGEEEDAIDEISE